VTPTTPERRRYFLLLVDDLSRYMWVVLLGSKGEAANGIRCAQAAAEAECGRKIRVLHTDNEGEFTTAEFTSSSGATRWLWGWLGPSSSRGECLLSSGERRW
jgi:hypothetical protein